MKITDLANRGSRKKKRWLSGLLILLGVFLALVLASCGEEEGTTTTAAPSSTAPATATSVGPTETTAPTETTTAEAQPVKGGKIKWILASLPQAFYYPETGPGDQQGLMPGMERLLTINSKRELAPRLAESIEEDPDNLTFTIHVRKGVKLHDGSELNADLLKWVLEEVKKAGKLNWGDYYESFEVADPYTVVAHISQWNNAMLAGLGQVAVFSRQALETKGLDWCRANFVGTGPFKMKEFNRDQNLVWTRNPDYWQKDEGVPYLDEIEFVFIPDQNTAKVAMEAGEADIWSAADNQFLAEMGSKGIVLRDSWPGRYGVLVPNLADQSSPLQKQEVREAIEYAIDREALNQALGYGLSIPVYEYSSPGHWGYGAAAATKREYNPEKAKQLLAQAGYADGLSINLLAMAQTGGSSTGAEAIKGYLEAAGFKVTLDIADVGRYYGSIFGTGWKDLVLVGICGYTEANDLIDLAYWWSGLASEIKWGSWKPSQELANLFNDALTARDPAAMEAKVSDIVALMSAQALICPLSYAPSTAAMQRWVHIDYPACGLIHADLAHAWVEKH